MYQWMGVTWCESQLLAPLNIKALVECDTYKAIVECSLQLLTYYNVKVRYLRSVFVLFLLKLRHSCFGWYV